MWQWWFGGRCTIYAVDVNPEARRHASSNVHVFIGDQANRTFWRELLASAPPFDFVLDDGGHTMVQQQVTFEETFLHLRDGGVFICEDTHTSYWPQYGGGLGRQALSTEGARVTDATRP